MISTHRDDSGWQPHLNDWFFVVYCEDVFTTKDTKSTKFGLSPEGFRPQGGVVIIRTLRVLRALRGEQNKLKVAHDPHKKLKKNDCSHCKQRGEPRLAKNRCLWKSIC
jgi:hypothetical protein